MKPVLLFILVALAASNKLVLKTEENGPIDVMRCLFNDETLLPNIQKIIAAVQTGDFSTIVSTLIEVGPSVYNSVVTCLSAGNEEEVENNIWKLIKKIKKLMKKLTPEARKVCEKIIKLLISHGKSAAKAYCFQFAEQYPVLLPICALL